jgi:hypothetical protein
MPLASPIFIYVLITSMIGGIQLFDVAQIFTQTSGGPQQSSETLMMYLYSLISLKQNYGQAGALSVLIFIVTAVLSMTVYRITNPRTDEGKEQMKSYKKRMKEYADCPATQANTAAIWRLKKGGSSKMATATLPDFASSFPEKNQHELSGSADGETDFGLCRIGPIGFPLHLPALDLAREHDPQPWQHLGFRLQLVVWQLSEPKLE